MKSFDALVIYPGHGSLWLSDVRLRDGFIEGETWDDTGIGHPYYPDDWRGESCTMNFPLSCLRKLTSKG